MLVYCGQTVGWIKMPLGMEVGLGPGHVLDGDPAPPPKGAQPPTQYTAHVCCDQTAGWIKMPLGTEEASAQATLCQMGSQLPRKGAQQPPLFGRCLLWPIGRLSQQLLSSCLEVSVYGYYVCVRVCVCVYRPIPMKFTIFSMICMLSKPLNIVLSTVLCKILFKDVFKIKNF